MKDPRRKIMGGSAVDAVHNHQELGAAKTHDGRSLWAVRQGATPIFPGSAAVVHVIPG